jgi:hypothetical protein
MIARLVVESLTIQFESKVRSEPGKNGNRVELESESRVQVLQVGVFEDTRTRGYVPGYG